MQFVKCPAENETNNRHAKYKSSVNFKALILIILPDFITFNGIHLYTNDLQKLTLPQGNLEDKQ